MAEVTKKVLVLKFGYTADSEKNVSINISKIKDGLTDTEIKNTMDAVVTAGALYKKDETTPVDKIVEANYVSTVTEELAL